MISKKQLLTGKISQPQETLTQISPLLEVQKV